jgi:predicted 3-demethylubiquinone-9 3-methyltransferase (glyoxalase superfamily)
MRKSPIASSRTITAHLWFDKEAKEAADFYCSLFPNSKILHESTVHGVPTPSGNCEIVSFELNEQPFTAISAGPMFKFNEAISFLIPCETQAEVDYYWEKLSTDPQAGQCGWLKDRFGLSWQVWPRAIGEILEKGTPKQVARVTKAMLPMKKFDIAALKEAYQG